ncbi:MAG: hypothetical protein U5L72_18140 [Bacteroidales bacterium]|nr:hypothetical protein [Bacteroidales bacterium]
MALAQSRGGARFCTRGAMQGYDGYYFILALAETVTQEGVPGGSRAALPPTTKLSSLARKSSRYGKANDIYRPVRASFYSQKFFNISFYVV